MITVNDVYKGDIVLNPKYIANMKTTNPNGKAGLKGAKTWINYIYTKAVSEKGINQVWRLSKNQTLLQTTRQQKSRLSHSQK